MFLYKGKLFNENNEISDALNDSSELILFGLLLPKLACGARGSLLWSEPRSSQWSRCALLFSVGLKVLKCKFVLGVIYLGPGMSGHCVFQLSFQRSLLPFLLSPFHFDFRNRCFS